MDEDGGLFLTAPVPALIISCHPHRCRSQMVCFYDLHIFHKLVLGEGGRGKEVVS